MTPSEKIKQLNELNQAYTNGIITIEERDRLKNEIMGYTEEDKGINSLKKDIFNEEGEVSKKMTDDSKINRSQKNKLIICFIMGLVFWIVFIIVGMVFEWNVWVNKKGHIYQYSVFQMLYIGWVKKGSIRVNTLVYDFITILTIVNTVIFIIKLTKLRIKTKNKQ